jgi:lysophospholipase L1-like esterase
MTSENSQKSVSIERLDPNMKSGETASVNHAIAWRSYADAAFTVCGLPWYGVHERALRRLPARAQAIVREPVWHLAQHPSGARLRFRTDSTSLRLRITQPFCEMINMCPIGHSGIDLYVGPPDAQVYWASVRPDLAAQRAGKPFETLVANKLRAEMREITLYLPVYNSLLDLEIGLDSTARVLPPTPYVLQRPMVFYGTSITQSGCASRPGNGYVPILGQLLGCDVVNLGFSGNGLGEPEMADLVAEIDASVFVLDYEANAGLDKMRDNLMPFAQTIRRAHPRTPLVILSKPFFSKVHMDAEGYEGAKRANTFFGEVVRTLNAAYPGPTRFVDGWTLIGPDTRYAYVDGVHPNDYGFALMAERLAPVLRELLA